MQAVRVKIVLVSTKILPAIRRITVIFK